MLPHVYIFGTESATGWQQVISSPLSADTWDVNQQQHPSFHVSTHASQTCTTRLDTCGSAARIVHCSGSFSKSVAACRDSISSASEMAWFNSNEPNTTMNKRINTKPTQTPLIDLESQ
mmetsp:Transcript_105943/g.242583  ORF Transcript_105943/g.242583 Transcript_105943/m.242583 type:complete len:118 (+) Transcript_105943:140-493(+)